MTLKEKVAEMEPEKVKEGFIGGVDGCPGAYSYLNNGAGITEPCDCGGNCTFCWNREFVPKEEYMETKKEAYNPTEATKTPSAVDHPSHYNHGGIECIDAIKAATVGLSGFEGFCAGNALKYLWRWKHKNGVEDLKKCQWYLDRLIEEQEEQA